MDAEEQGGPDDAAGGEDDEAEVVVVEGEEGPDVAGEGVLRGRGPAGWRNPEGGRN